MKTVKEISENVNVSKTSIYNLIKKHSIPTFRKQGKTFLDESAENLIIGYYSIEQHETISDILTDAKTSQENSENEFQDNKSLEYIKVIDILEDERTEKNNIIKELVQSNKILCQALAADKVNETARLMISGVKESNTPKGFFSRILKKKIACHAWRKISCLNFFSEKLL